MSVNTSRRGRRFPVFPKVDTPYGQAPMGLEGSGASRRPGSKGSEGSKGGGAPLIYRWRPFMIKPLQPPCGRRKCTPFGGWRHHLPPGGGTLFFAMR